jgi:hypothetical protein
LSDDYFWARASLWLAGVGALPGGHAAVPGIAQLVVSRL